MRRLVALGAPAVVGALAAEARAAAPAIGAAAAAQRSLENDAVAFLDFMDRGRVAAELLDAAQDFMDEDDRINDLEFAVEEFDVRAADAAHFHFHQPAVGRNIGDRVLADFELVRTE